MKMLTGGSYTFFSHYFKQLIVKVEWELLWIPVKIVSEALVYYLLDHSLEKICHLEATQTGLTSSSIKVKMNMIQILPK